MITLPPGGRRRVESESESLVARRSVVRARIMGTDSLRLSRLASRGLPPARGNLMPRNRVRGGPGPAAQAVGCGLRVGPAAGWGDVTFEKNFV